MAKDYFTEIEELLLSEGRDDEDVEEIMVRQRNHWESHPKPWMPNRFTKQLGKYANELISKREKEKAKRDRARKDSEESTESA